MEGLFWIGMAGVFYAYFGYPLLLVVWGWLRPRTVREDEGDPPPISVILPVHNEAEQLPGRLDDLLSQDYPSERIQLLVVSDGSTDGTVELARDRAARDPRIRVLELRERGGKGRALNAGVAAADRPVLVFTDAGIRLDPGSLRALVAPLSDPQVGCVSGEDRIEGAGGEGLYGRYELLLRRMESRVGSIVGASGSLYAQRKALCPVFTEGRAPDFLSVLHTVRAGSRAVSEPSATGAMRAAPSHGREFQRKTRTVLRGMTALADHRGLLNPFRHGGFALVLFSHKVMRWLVPIFLLAVAVGNVALLGRPFFLATGVLQGALYLAALLSLLGVPRVRDALLPRAAAFFLLSNVAIVVAWTGFLRGRRQEVWAPTRR